MRQSLQGTNLLLIIKTIKLGSLYKIFKDLTACADDPGDVDIGEAVGELVDVDDAVAGDLLPVRLTLETMHRV